MLEINNQELCLPDSISERLDALTAEWNSASNVKRFWNRDESLWTSSGESDWLGWLEVGNPNVVDSRNLRMFAEQIRGKYSHSVLLGMGGSSLCPEVLRLCFGVAPGYPDLQVLDSTDPDHIRDCEDSIDMGSTLFISASKSGSTLETALLTRYFWDRLSGLVGTERTGAQFAAITDPGSRLEMTAIERGFRHLLYGVPTIGGRYSALSNFGLAPAAAMGIDVSKLLNGALAMKAACGPEAGPEANPGVRLGLLLGAASLAGRDKLTLVSSPSLAPLGAWIEQLVAESTGKRGKGIVPVDGEALADPPSYGRDRVFAAVELQSEQGPDFDRALGRLARAGHPVVRMRLQGLIDISQEFFRWEVATAVAGSVLGINPFDQPDVESAKVAARRLTDSYETSGSLPVASPLIEEASIQLFAAPEHAARLIASAADASLPSILRAHLHTAGSGDYLALLAFVCKDSDTVATLARMRAALRSHLPVATCTGFGPRYLHSTGQLHKGGRDSGVFLIVGGDNSSDVQVPGRDLTFGVVKHAQAEGDFLVLQSLGRRALRVHISGRLGAGLAQLESALEAAVQ